MASFSIKTKDILIDPQSPFDNDLLDREEEIKNLTNIIQNVEDPLVVAINAPWGTGKTTFIRLWCAYLEQQSLDFISFNAWETDFAEDPLIPLVSELGKWINQKKGYPNGEWNNFVKQVMPKLVKHIAVTSVKLATHGVIDDKDITKILTDSAGEMTGDLLDQFNQKLTASKDFKKQISNVLSELPENQNLIIFIDELDRCRPTYAIELLERVKHLFDIERLVFILSTDLEQLSHSICAVYGNNFESKKYLKRFIDLDYSLKEPDLQMYIKNKFQELNYIKKEETSSKQELLFNLVFFFTKRLNLELRSVNLIIQRLTLVVSTIPKHIIPNSIPLVTLLFLREYNLNLYKKYQISQNKFEEIIEFLTNGILVKNATQKDKNNYIDCLIKIIAFLLVFRDNSDIDEVEEKIFDKCVSQIIKCDVDIPTYSNHGWYDHESYTLKLQEEIQKFQEAIREINILSKPSYIQNIAEHIELLYRLDI